MNSYERLMGRLEGKKVDRLPNMGLVMFLGAKEAGVSFGDYITNYNYLVEGALRCHEKYGIDMVCAISDPLRETAGFGAEVVIREEGTPYCKTHRVKDASDIASLKQADPYRSWRMHDRVEAIRALKERVRNDVPVVGWIEGALAECCDLMDMQIVFSYLIEEPEMIEEMMEICLEQAILFAKAQVEMGADIIGVGDAAASLIGPSLYEDYALPFEQRLIQAIHDMGAKTKLHICGNTNALLPYIVETKTDILDLDHMVDIVRASKILPENMCICGNFDPATILYQGTPELVREEVKRCMGIRDKNRNLIAAGCEIPRDAPEENVLAIQKTIEEFS